jgi:hypothetical protein
MMVKILVSLILGGFGLKVLAFYIQNSAYINSIVFLYGVFLVYSHLNYKRVAGKWITKAKDDAKAMKKMKDKINWEKEIGENSNFPFIAGNVSLIPKRTSRENLLFYLNKDNAWKKLMDSVEKG